MVRVLHQQDLVESQLREPLREKGAPKAISPRPEGTQQREGGSAGGQGPNEVAQTRPWLPPASPRDSSVPVRGTFPGQPRGEGSTQSCPSDPDPPCARGWRHCPGSCHVQRSLRHPRGARGRGQLSTKYPSARCHHMCTLASCPQARARVRWGTEQPRPLTETLFGHSQRQAGARGWEGASHQAPAQALRFQVSSCSRPPLPCGSPR